MAKALHSSSMKPLRSVLTTEPAEPPALRGDSPRPTVDDALFPLPLTPFEIYMLLDDGPSHPMQFTCRLQCLGELDTQHLVSAFQLALSRHPLLTAIVRQIDEKRFEWVAAPSSCVQWQRRPAQHDEPPFIDIKSQPGVQITYQIADNASELVFRFHHAACDGLAAMDFIADVLVAYSNLELGDDRYGWKSLDRQRLRRRGQSGVSTWQWSAWCLRNIPLLPAAYRFYKRRPQPLFQHCLDSSQPRCGPSALTHHFSAEDSRRLRAAAQQGSTTVNTLLLRDLLLACHDLRQARGGVQPDDWLRVTIPLSMRGTADRQLPAANMVSLGFVDRPVAALHDPHALLRGIDDSLKRMVQRRWGLGFLTGLAVMREFPNTLARQLRRQRCFSTVLLSNFGNALPGCSLPRSEGQIRAGNVVVRDVEFIPLLRPLQLANFAVSQYAGRYALGMRYDSRHLDERLAQSVLHCYVSQVRQTLSSASPS